MTAGDSCSTQHQKQILSAYAKNNGFVNPVHFVDDGYSGMTFDRPDVQKLLAMVECGEIGIIIVKDQSRLGRNYFCRYGSWNEAQYLRNVSQPQRGLIVRRIPSKSMALRQIVLAEIRRVIQEAKGYADEILQRAMDKHQSQLKSAFH